MTVKLFKTKFMKLLRYLYIPVFIVIIVSLLMFLFLKPMLNINEQTECYTWKAQATQYENYYLTDWQKQQCNHHGIQVIVPKPHILWDFPDPLLPCGNVWSCDEEVNKLEGYKDAETRDYYKGISIPKWAPGPVEQQGKASWYDYSLKGAPDYSKTHATAASRDYKRGTKLTVCTYPTETLKTKCVSVVVNDYGPKAYTGKIIDLSSYAFKKLYPLSQGVGGVIIRTEE